MGYIYLGQPYKHEQVGIMALRYQQALNVTASAINAGHAIYSPIVHNHHLAIQFNLPREFSFWQDYDLTMLAGAADMWILPLPGWSISNGLTEERHYWALTRDKPPEFVDWERFQISSEITLTYNEPLYE